MMKEQIKKRKMVLDKSLRTENKVSEIKIFRDYIKIHSDFEGRRTDFLFKPIKKGKDIDSFRIQFSKNGRRKVIKHGKTGGQIKFRNSYRRFYNNKLENNPENLDWCKEIRETNLSELEKNLHKFLEADIFPRVFKLEKISEDLFEVNIKNEIIK